MSTTEPRGPPPVVDARPDAAARRFGTFGGVFTPCTLTILGVIMYLRFGQVVGTAGVLGGLAIVLMAKTITTLTALSLSAIATNTRVKGGGAYYLISRSLGVEYGGSIGILFYLAQAVSVAMYVIGFSEAFVATFPQLELSARDVATLVNLGVFATVYLGASWAIKIQYGILALLAASLLSFFAGAFDALDAQVLSSNLWMREASAAPFFVAFALFFPAATGIMAGANLSGDLRDPARSIPRGTLSAILVTGFVYLALATVLGAVAPREVLLADPLIMEKIGWSSALVTAGIFAATLSSALGSMMGAPRVLQALARDRIFRRLSFFGAGAGAEKEPRRATVLTFMIAEVCILLGDLDAIAPIITMFFLITYGYLNLATFRESITRNPSYRPTFRFSHWATALMGAVGCVGVMFLISPLWAAAAVATMAVLHLWIGSRARIATWGDLKSGAAFERARRDLIRLEEDRYHPKNWRPSILALSGTARTRTHLAVYAHWLSAGRGAVTLAQVIPGEVKAHLERRSAQENALRSFIRDQELSAFPAVLVAPDLSLGIEALVQCYGIGAFRPNVVLSGWSEDPAREEEFASLLRTVSGLGRSLVLVRYRGEAGDAVWIPSPGPIDVWWRGKQNGHLLVLLAHLLAENDAWRGREIRLHRVVPAEAGQAGAKAHLEELLAAARVEATPVVHVADAFLPVLRHACRRSAVVFLGFQPPAPGEEAAFVESLTRMMRDLDTVVLVWSAGEVHLHA
ncbi:MAG: APC family permease [Planctomycetota bacterium]|jgi:amino acid transporter